jgi:hypothetical protein
MEEKVYQVREYSDFPHRFDSDEVVKEFSNFKEASFYSIGINRKYEKDTSRKYYVMDEPHEHKEFTDEQRQILKEKYGLE